MRHAATEGRTKRRRHQHDGRHHRRPTQLLHAHVPDDTWKRRLPGVRGMARQHRASGGRHPPSKLVPGARRLRRAHCSQEVVLLLTEPRTGLTNLWSMKGRILDRPIQ